MFLQFFAKRKEKTQAYHLYKLLVDQARLPAFYSTPYSMPDTMEGRLEMIFLHLFLVDHWLSVDADTVRLRRFLREILVSDMDRSLREMGIGDMSISKEMKKIGAALLGRMASFEQAMQVDSGPHTLRETIARNVTEGNDLATNAFVSYVDESLTYMKSIPLGQGRDVDTLFVEP